MGPRWRLDLRLVYLNIQGKKIVRDKDPDVSTITTSYTHHHHPRALQEKRRNLLRIALTCIFSSIKASRHPLLLLLSMNLSLHFFDIRERFLLLLSFFLSFTARDEV